MQFGRISARIALPDDVELLTEMSKVCAAARMVNAGQSCIAGKRFIVVRDVIAAFEEAMVKAMRGFEIGDPRDDKTRLGPMQSIGARDEIHAQVEASVAGGARLLLGVGSVAIAIAAASRLQRVDAAHERSPAAV